MGEKSGLSTEEKRKGKERESVLQEDVFAGQSYLQSELLPSNLGPRRDTFPLLEDRHKADPVRFSLLLVLDPYYFMFVLQFSLLFSRSSSLPFSSPETSP